MEDTRETDLKGQFLHPSVPYYGDSPTLARVAFSANVNDMAQRLGIVAGLISNGKIEPEDAYSAVRQHWKALKKSAKSLGIKKRKKQD